MSMTRRSFIGVVVLAAVFAAAGGGAGTWWYLQKANDSAHKQRKNAGEVCRRPAPRPPVEVRAVVVRASDTQTFNTFPGSVQSKLTVRVSARLTAHVREVPVRAGDTAAKGALLVRLDDDEVRAELRQAESALASAEAARLEAEAALAEAEAGRVEAESDYRRYKKLVAGDAASVQELDRAEAKWKTAVAAVKRAEAAVKRAAAGVRQAGEKVKETRIGLSYTEIRCPFAAVVVDRFADPGDLAAPGRTLLTLQSPDQLRFEAPVSEYCARFVHNGDPVRVKIDAAGLLLDIRVTEIVPAVDRRSRSFLVRATLPPKAGLKPGMFGRFLFPCAVRKILAVPRQALRRQGQLELIFVVENGRARLRLVRSGRAFGDKLELISGLTAGETVVVAPPPALRDGDPVKITGTPWKTSRSQPPPPLPRPASRKSCPSPVKTAADSAWGAAPGPADKPAPEKKKTPARAVEDRP